uniref:Protein kinase domain-containing protein n=1 Tax=Poecilia mexicana TaxID=48701 RepID=A0A3B3YCT0_9TELE
MRSAWCRVRWSKCSPATSRTCSWCTGPPTSTPQRLKAGSLATCWDIPHPPPHPTSLKEPSSKRFFFFCLFVWYKQDFFFFVLFCFSRGRFSVTKRCDQRGSKRTIAAKHVNKKLLCREQVLQEIRLLQTLDHPNLVRLLDTYETAHSYVLVLEMADQGRFLDYIVSWGNLTEEKVALYLRDILEALQYLHGWKVAHLDLKVSGRSLLYLHISQVSLIKLTDFGDAVQLDPHSSHIHPLLGSPEFSAPELVLAYACLPNVFAGVVTYVLLSGASPFLDESLEETCLNICRLDFSFPEDYFQGVSTEAKDFVCLLLQGELERRPSAGFCLQYPWLQPRGVASGGYGHVNHMQPPSPSHYGTHLDTSRLISFIERRKHQNDVRPVGAIQAFLHSRLYNHT